jgi:predicted DNA-binding transcriptional regulator AlpA
MQTAVEFRERDVKPPPSPFSETLIDSRVVARFLGVSDAGFAGMLHRGDGPSYLRIGRLIRFSPAAVKAWALSQVEINSSANTGT